MNVSDLITPQSVIRGVQESLHTIVGGRTVEEGIASKVAEGGGGLDVLNLLRELEGEMREAAAALEYERAALLRDQIRELKASAGLPATEVAGAEKFGKARPVTYRGGKKRAAKPAAGK